MDFSGKKIGVLGAGITGLSVFKLLKARSYPVIIWDDNIKNLVSNVIEDDIRDITSDDWKKIDLLVVSPGIAISYPKAHYLIDLARSLNIKVIGDIELAYCLSKSKHFIAITGTNGKSTVTKLIGDILSHSNIVNHICGNVGFPICDIIDSEANSYYVVECSSYQLEAIQNFRAKISIILNITPDHLDRYKDFQSYVDAKKNIFINSKEEDFIILNIDDENVQKIYFELLELGKCKNIIPVSMRKHYQGGALIENYRLKYKDHILHLPQQNMYLQGPHNLMNMAVAAICGLILKLEDVQILAGVKNFIGLEHRMEYLGKYKDVTFINDSKATNIESSIQALASYDNIIWIAGGKMKGEVDFKISRPFLSKIKHAFFIGEAKHVLSSFYKDKISYNCHENLEDAFNQAVSKSSKGDVVLLSPAFASFDQFKSFVERGNKFKELFNLLQVNN